MTRKLLFLAVLVPLFVVSLQAEHLFPKVRSSHFLLPSRTLFFFRPDLFVFGNHFPLARSFGIQKRISYCPVVDVPQVVDAPQSLGVYRLILNSPKGEIVRANTSDLIFTVHPSKALVYVDDKLIGSARDFSTERDYYTLISGSHRLRIEFPGYKPFETELEVMPDRTLHLDIELEMQEDSNR